MLVWLLLLLQMTLESVLAVALASFLRLAVLRRLKIGTNTEYVSVRQLQPNGRTDRQSA